MIRLAVDKPIAVDLFAGAGLFSYAFAAEGFDLSFAVEMDRVAAATYAANMGGHVRVADIRQVQPEGTCDVILAGPPCQGFSTLGKRDCDDPRNHLSMEVVRWATVLRPKVVVIENVAAFLGTPSWQHVASRLKDIGYEVTAYTVNAYMMGVPQRRERSFTFASKVGTPRLTAPGRRTKTVREAWAGLPAVPNGVNHHYAPTPSPLALARMAIIPPGGDKRDVLRDAPHLAPPSWTRVPGEVTDVWGRLLWDEPSNTLRTSLLNPSKGRYIHPEQNRVMSLREAARLQTIPDGWQFVGLPTQIARQIGNSVPPTLGRAIARAVKRILV